MARSALGLLVLAGCAAPPRLPAPLETHDQTRRAYDLNDDGAADYWQTCDATGRIHVLEFGARGGAPEEVALDEILAAECPHFVIVLDGVPFEIVRQLRDSGRFRLFHPPSRVICGYPSMTDLALTDVFGGGRCLAFQALYFNRQANHLSDGHATYLSGRNSPWLGAMAYRCSPWWDTLVYLDPQAVFNHELDRIREKFRAATGTQRVCVYSVGSAGLATRDGRAGIERYLRQVDALCEWLVYERRGRVKITLLADHGHNLVENRLVSFDDVLRAGGYHPARSLRGPRDVVVVAYGLVTYAELHTRDPAGVAACLLQQPDVEFTCYPADDGVVVLDRAGDAWLTRREGGYVYETRGGDPLRLGSIITSLRAAGGVSADGVIDAAALFNATVDHEYPDPLARLWRAFYGYVDHPPDVIANLRDGACHGSRFFHALIGRVASTHGSLNRANSTTFVMTMLGELPPALRSVLPTE